MFVILCDSKNETDRITIKMLPATLRIYATGLVMVERYNDLYHAEPSLDKHIYNILDIENVWGYTHFYASEE
jgi:hypothetical protein